MHRCVGRSPYVDAVDRAERDIERLTGRVRALVGVRPTDTGLAPGSAWDLAADAVALRQERGLVVARVTTALPAREDGALDTNGRDANRRDTNRRDDASDARRYVVEVPHQGRYVVGLADHVSPADVAEDARVGLDRDTYRIRLPLPLPLEACVSTMQVEETTGVDFADVGGCDEQLERIREVVEIPLLHPERFARLGVEPPKGALMFGSPGGGKTLCARAVAGSAAASFIRVVGSELVQRYIGQGAHLVGAMRLDVTAPFVCLFVRFVSSWNLSFHIPAPSPWSIAARVRRPESARRAVYFRRRLPATR